MTGLPAQYMKQEVLKIRLVTYIALQTSQWSVCSKNCPFYDATNWLHGLAGSPRRPTPREDG